MPGEKTTNVDGYLRVFSQAGAECAEYSETSGQCTLMSVLLRRIDVRYKVRQGVTEEHCLAFLSDTRNIFSVMHEVVPNDPFVHFLSIMSNMRTEKSALFRTTVVASLLRPHDALIRQHDEAVLLGDRGILSCFSSIAIPIMHGVWKSLTPDNRERLWMWIEHILNNVCMLTESAQ